jgi:hypothetical protein
MDPTAIGVLTNEYCRRTVDSLLEADPAPAAIPDIETGLATTGLDERQARVHLYHVVLPKLAAVEMIEYDWQAGLVWFDADRDARRTLTALLGRESDSLTSPGA